MDITNPLFQVYIISTVILGLNLLVLANNTALSRAMSNEAVNPEDRALNAKAEVVFYNGNSLTQRYRRAHANALENVPLFLITAFGLTLLPVPLWLGASLMGLFVVVRVAHSLAYRFELQPWRTASFATGALIQLVILGVLAYYALFA